MVLHHEHSNICIEISAGISIGKTGSFNSVDGNFKEILIFNTILTSTQLSNDKPLPCHKVGFTSQYG